MYSIASEADRAKLSVCCLQEVRYRNRGKRRITVASGAEYDFIWSGPKRRRDAGVGFLVKVDQDIVASEPDMESSRLIAMNIIVHGFKIRLVNAYSPTNTDGSIGQKDEFYRKLRKACIPTAKNHKLVVAGDFNAITSVVLRNSCFSGMSVIEDETCNDNGSRLKQFCRSEKLCMIQTYFDKPLVERYTWFSNDGITKRILDYILMERFVQQYVTDCFVASNCQIESDHRLVVSCLSTPKTKRARWQILKRRERPIYLKALECENIQKAYIENVKNKLPITDVNDSMDIKSQKIVDALNQAAKDTVPRSPAKITREIWKNDTELNSALRERTKFERNSDSYKELSKKIKKRVQILRNQKLKKEADELNSFANKRQLDSLFKAFKDDNSAFKKCPSTRKCDPSKLTKHFRDHFKSILNQPSPKELETAPTFINRLQNIKYDSMRTESPSAEEIRAALKTLKNKKSANDVPAELLKCAAADAMFLAELTQLFSDVWLENKVPSHWGHSKLVALWKGPAKGKEDDPTAHRALQIGSTLCKLMVIIIITRIHDWYEKQLLDQQQGFRKGRGTTDGIFIAKSLQQMAKKTGKEVNVLFVDLSAAFDHVNRRWLFRSIKQRLKGNVDCKLFDLLEALYSSTTSSLAGNELEKFIIELGVRQGGSESPLLFNLYMDYVMRVYLAECARQNIKFMKSKYTIPKSVFQSNALFAEYGEQTLDWVGYADDLLLAFSEQAELRKGLIILNNVFERFGLKLNVGKTKTMIYNYNHERDYPTSIASVNNEAVDNVAVFYYLGSQIHYQQAMTGDAEITSRIDMAESKFYEHGKNL